MFVLKFKISISTRPAQLTDVQVGSPPLRWGQTIFVQKRFFSNCFFSPISILECQLTSKILLSGGHPCPTCSFIFNWETGEWKKTVLSSYLFVFSSSFLLSFVKFRLVILARVGPAMVVLRTSVLRLTTIIINVSTKGVLMIWNQDSGVRVLVAGGWSGHNIRTAEVKKNTHSGFTKFAKLAKLM